VTSRTVAVAALAALLASCGGVASTLDPAGPRAARIAELTWLMTGIAALVYVLVLAILFVAIFRRSKRGQRRWPLSDTAMIVGGGILLPAIILPILWVATLRDMRALAEPPSSPTVTIDVIGHQFGYEVRYEEHGVVLRNEMRIPVGKPILLRVTSTDVIHSFWVPRLMEKVDMIPGRINERWFEATEPGSYLVECAEFCGLLHAKMQMRIVAEPPDAFEAWLRSR
jgi:cytochrome c oxidase subunit 2